MSPAPLAWLVAGGLLALLALHLALAVRLLRGRRAPEPPQRWPAAEVVLCLRGADPQLGALLAALAQQRYPGPWRLQVVVDSPADGAWPVVERALAPLAGKARWAQVDLQSLSDPAAAGSRKCAALLQAFERLDPAAAAAVVALVDGDAAIGPDWLATLVAGCLEPGVGAVSGNRWYAPQGGSGAGELRAIWNAGALLLMAALQVPWAGSLALRRPLLAASDWPARLRHSLCEDTALLQPLRQAGWRYRLLPQLLSCERHGLAWGDLPALERWISRQLLLVRLHHPGWPWLAAHATSTSLLPLAALGLLLVAPVAAPARAALVAVLLATDLLWVGLLLGLGRALGQPPPRRPLLLPLWVPLTQGVYAVAALRAATARRVRWRGITYGLRRQGGRWWVSPPAGSAAAPPTPGAGSLH